MRGGGGINTVVTSKEAILAGCRALAAAEGLQAINMRAVAARCHVSVGSVYNYFPSKSDLLLKTIESIWQDIFHGQSPAADSFPDTVAWLFDSVSVGAAKYPQFFAAHSQLGAKEKARQLMTAYFGHIKAGLLAALEADARVSPDAFSDTFSRAEFVDFVFSAVLTLLTRQATSCDLLLEMIRRSIY
ncbi:MAG: TetR/AcrR family transcriptional regulator [Oscillospiraceae bacterium]